MHVIFRQTYPYQWRHNKYNWVCRSHNKNKNIPAAKDGKLSATYRLIYKLIKLLIIMGPTSVDCYKKKRKEYGDLESGMDDQNILNEL